MKGYLQSKGPPLTIIKNNKLVAVPYGVLWPMAEGLSNLVAFNLGAIIAAAMLLKCMQQLLL